MTIPEVAQVISAAADMTLLGVAISLTRYFSRIEFRVNQMWAVFSRKFGTRGEDLEQADDSVF